MSVRTPTLLCLGAFASYACGGRESDLGAGRGSDRRVLALSAPVALHGPPESVVVRPDPASEDCRGRSVLVDPSDRNVKVYGPDGALAGIVGRAGHGPG